MNYGGGLFLENAKNLKIQNSSFIDNYAFYKGGGTYFNNIEVINI